MALTATFAADFDRFESALKGAAFNLQVFDRATAKAMQSLKKETETFSGQKVAVEAARMAEAVTRLGGAGGSAAGLLKLLPDELKRVSASLETAAAKAKLLGETLPPSLQKVREEIAKMPQATTSATTGISGLASAFKTLGPLLGITSIAGAVTAITRLGLSAIESASQINDLSKQLGVSTDFIQEMQHVAEQTGSSVETFAKATFTLGVNVAKGSQAARDAVKDLGLSYQDLEQQLPEDELRTVIKALEDVENVQERNRLGTALLGKTWKEMATAVAEGMTEIADGAPKMSKATIDALDSMGDAWDTMKAKAKVAAGEVIASIWTTIQSIERASDSMTNWRKLNLWLQGGLSFDAYLAELKKVGDEMKALDEAADRIIRESKLAIGPEAPKAAEDYAKALDDINKKIAALKPEELKQLTAAIALGGEAAKEYAESIGLGADGLEVFKDHTAKATAALKEFNKDMAESVVWGGGIAEADHWMEELAKHARELESKMVKFADLFEMGPDIHMGTFQKWLDSRTEAVRAWSQTNQKKITEIFDFGPDPQIGIISEQMDKQAKSITGQLEKVFASLPDTLARAFEGGGGLAGAFKSIGVQIADAISEPIIKSLTRMQKAAVSAGATAATAFGGGVGGGLGATVGALAGTIGGATLAASSLGVAAATSATAALALGAATFGIGAAAVGVALLAKHFLTVSKDIKEARKQLEDFNKSMNETLTRQQQMEAGGQQWAATLIQVRDAMIALGVPLEQALAQSQALVKQLLNTDDPRRSRAAMEQIAVLMQRLELAKESAGGIFDDIVDLAEQGIPDFLQPMIDQLIELGLLTDEQEQKLREMGDAGATNWKRIEEAAAKYGVRQESLGQPFNAQRIAADAAGIINAFTAITNAGGDVGGVLFDMQDEISKVVQDAKQFGTTIPANMKPWIEELSRAGLLVDENGELIKDMSGIQFGDEIKTEAEKTREAFESITEAIRELIRTINSIPAFPGGGSGGGGGGGTSYSPTEPGPVAAMTAGAGGGGNTFNVPIQVDGRTIADVVIDQMGNRLSVRGAR